MADKTKKSPTTEIVIGGTRIPIAPEDKGYAPSHVELVLDRVTERMLRRIRIGLDRSGAKLRNGRPVTSGARAVQYILEQIEGSIHDEA